MPGGNVAPKPSKPTPKKDTTNYSQGVMGSKGPADKNKVQMMLRAQEMRKENLKKTTTTKKINAKTGTTTASTQFVAAIPLPPPPGDGPSTDESSYDFTPKSIKIPDRDAIIALKRDGADQALITAILFEQIGATELVKFTRNDTIDGLNGVYDVISNISELKTKLDPSYLISKQRPDVTIDNGFSIRLQDKLPSIDYLFENEIPNYVHFDSTMGDGGSLVIELDNMDTDEIIEVEIDTSGTIEEVR